MTSYTTLSCLVLDTSDKAVKIRRGESFEDMEEHWVPFSLIRPEDLAALRVGERQELGVETWFVKKEKIT